MKRKVSIILFLILASLLFSSLGQAQTYSYVDTLIVVNTSGAPGDLEVYVPVSLVNAIPVAGYSFRIIFNPAVLTATSAMCSERANYFGESGYKMDSGSAYFWATASSMGGHNPPLDPGKGVIAYVAFKVDSNATVGSNISLTFQDDPGGSPPMYNSLTDTNYQMIFPVLRGGTFTISSGPANHAPILDPIPGGTSQSVYEGQTLAFTVSASDPDGDRITLSASNLPPNSSFPLVSGDSTASSTFTFNPDNTQGGNQYTVTFTVEDTLGLTDFENVTISVEEVANFPPVFSQIPSGFQSVIEGDVLAFTVAAYDPEGGPVTLSTGALPPNATFVDNGDGTGDFVFSPDFSQGPDTLTVTFVAKDTAQATTSKGVQIIVIDRPMDILRADTTGGALPGGDYGFSYLSFFNSDSIYGVQFNLGYDASVLTIDSLIPTDRLSGLTLYDNIGDTPGQVKVIIMGYNLETISPGNGPILKAYFTVEEGIQPGITPLTLSDAIEVIDIYGTTKDLLTEDGFFTIDALGDVTLNGKVDVGDVVALVAYILDQIEFNLRQMKVGDVNLDDDVNIGDVVGVINVILGRPVGKGAPAKGLYEEWLAQVQLDLRDLENGNAYIWGKLDVPVAGVQLKLDYDPSQIAIFTPKLTERTRDFTLVYSDKDGVFTILLFDPTGGAISTGEGNLFYLPVEKITEDDSVDFELSQAVMADTMAWCIPVEIMHRNTGVGDSPEGFSIPQSFVLGQNFPNPFNPITQISYQIPQRSFVRLYVYNTLGQRVATLVERDKPAGFYQVNWNGRGDGGEELGSGIYFYTFISGTFKETKKMLMIK